MINRTFHPVGQGAFYSEEFEDGKGEVLFRVVYDCGCRHGESCQKHGIGVLTKVIVRWKGSGHPDVDYLFISHFDFDHVSLLKTLKDNGVKVKRVISPLLEQNEKAALVNFYKGVLTGAMSRFVRRLVENPGEMLWGENVQVMPLEANGQLVNDDFGENAIRGGPVPSGTRFPVNISGVSLDWRYIPCNFDSQSRGQQFRDALKKKFGKGFDPTTLEDFPRLMKLRGRAKNRAFRKLKAVYDSIEGNINENSMTVYSGPISGETKATTVGCFSTRECAMDECPQTKSLQCSVYGDSAIKDGESLGPACVYTGDVDLGVAKVRDWYGDFWSYVGVIQVPHHGSRLSFDPAPFSGGHYCCPISCSDKCYYKHPHACVTNALVAEGNRPLRVTESVGFEQMVGL